MSPALQREGLYSTCSSFLSQFLSCVSAFHCSCFYHLTGLLTCTFPTTLFIQYHYLKSECDYLYGGWMVIYAKIANTVTPKSSLQNREEGGSSLKTILLFSIHTTTNANSTKTYTGTHTHTHTHTYAHTHTHTHTHKHMPIYQKISLFSFKICNIIQIQVWLTLYKQEYCKHEQKCKVTSWTSHITQTKNSP